MDDRTARLALPLLAAGQAQKEVLHNEALAVIDLLLQGTVEAILDTPPAAPAEGQAWIVGTAPSGEWAGTADAIAAWTAGGWRFVPALEGMDMRVRGGNLSARRTATGWEIGALDATELRIDGLRVVGPRQSAIAAPAGGAIVDSEARAAIVAVLSVLQSHGLVAE